eukprot:TRINITY_DN5205_c0_g1_i1.p1 TRINITY_DN5205_c0_g1~~TRINITY_DN5205_c0_g1_i1.p1  ORF type:complete len:516 (+),score=121.92 TRINITY_DN5205_c0_g1_i1:185-1732(+)
MLHTSFSPSRSRFARSLVWLSVFALVVCVTILFFMLHSSSEAECKKQLATQKEQFERTVTTLHTTEQLDKERITLLQQEIARHSPSSSSTLSLNTSSPLSLPTHSVSKPVRDLSNLPSSSPPLSLPDDLSYHQMNALTSQTAPPGTPILIFTFNRAQSLQKTLDSLLQYRPARHAFPIIISQDGEMPPVTQMIEQYRSKIYHFRHYYQTEIIPENEKILFQRMPVYFKIASHYRFAFTKLFDELNYERVIVIEDDMFVAPDFYEYFAALIPLLSQDPSVYCVSAWNDNGQEKFVRDPTALYRTDCFPGLGWMITKKLWEELRPGWKSFWDDWMRLPAQRKGRSCIVPEINRVYTFGKEGASSGAGFEEYLRPIKLNSIAVDWPSIDLANMAEEPYNEWLYSVVNTATPSRIEDLLSSTHLPSSSQFQSANEPLVSAISKDKQRMRFYSIDYSDLRDLSQLLGRFRLMDDHKDGVPRASYKGIILFYFRDYRILFRPTDWRTRFSAVPSHTVRRRT